MHFLARLNRVATPFSVNFDSVIFRSELAIDGHREIVNRLRFRGYEYTFGNGKKIFKVSEFHSFLAGREENDLFFLVLYVRISHFGFPEISDRP